MFSTVKSVDLWFHINTLFVLSLQVIGNPNASDTALTGTYVVPFATYISFIFPFASFGITSTPFITNFVPFFALIL